MSEPNAGWSVRHHHQRDLDGAALLKPPTITLRECVVRATDGGSRLVGPVDLTLAAGRWTSLLGRSGAGKSSILRAVADLEPNRQGDISADDQAPLLGRVALMAQDPLLAPWAPLWANVAFGDRVRGRVPSRHRIDFCLDAVGLRGKGLRRPTALSGGERQRAALARTLYENRPVALLDEPFSALDALTRDEVSTLAADHLSGRTVAHVTHDPLEAARLADRIYILSPNGNHIVEAPLAAAANMPTPRPPDDAAVFELATSLKRQLAALETMNDKTSPV